MPKTVALAPLTHPTTGKPVATGDEITLSDEDYAALRADGKVAASEAETKANTVTASPEGVYNARTTRGDSTEAEPDPKPEPKAEAPLPGPSAPTPPTEKHK